MTAQVQQFVCTLQPGSTAAAPATVPMQLGVFTVDWVELDIPAGLNGSVGFYLAASGQQYIPFRVGNLPNWYVANNVNKHWDVVDFPTSGDWSLVGYNLGNYPHAITVIWGLDPIDVPGGSGAAPAPIDLGALTGTVS